jgi:hypothetical protein
VGDAAESRRKAGFLLPIRMKRPVSNARLERRVGLSMETETIEVAIGSDQGRFPQGTRRLHRTGEIVLGGEK